MKELAAALMNVAALHEDPNNWTPGARQVTGKYKKTVYDIAYATCENKHIAQIVSILLQPSSWNDALDWAKEVTNER